MAAALYPRARVALRPGPAKIGAAFLAGDAASERGAGALYALLAYGLWGFAPIYWKEVEHSPAPELLAYRVIASLGVALLMIVALRAWRARRRAALSAQRGERRARGAAARLLVLQERLTQVQALAVGVAALGVGVHTVLQGELPWVALVLATSFGLCGLVRKMGPAAPLACVLLASSRADARRTP